MIAFQMGRRRLIQGALVSLVTMAFTSRRGKAVHITWKANVQEGTCEAPVADSRISVGSPSYGVPVGTSAPPEGTPPLQFRTIGPPSVVPVVTSSATVDLSLDDLLANPYSVVIESVDLESEERTLLACGNVGGVRTDDEVVFGLRSQAADTSGMAWLKGTAEGTTDITLFVTQGLTSGGAAPMQTPAPSEASARAEAETETGTGTPAAETEAPASSTEVEIGSYDIYFEPNDVTIPANSDVTIILPNHGMTLHNFSITDHKNPDVPNLGIDIDLPVGVTETITINAPANDYYFYCNVPGHEAAGMFGTLHVA